MEALPIEKIKHAARATWSAGDFGVVAKTISGGAEEFVARLPEVAGLKVLDVATGSGNVAIPLARRGAIVTGVDIAANLLEQARVRAAAEGLSATFDEGDAEQMPYADGEFDVVTSMFGAMFAPRPEVVACELARVLKPGGLLAMANWTPGSFTGTMFRLGSKFLPPAAGSLPPVMWGDESTVRQRLTPYFADVKTERIPIDFDLPMNAAGAVEFFRKYFGPTVMAFSKLDEAGQAAYAAEFEAIWAEANVAENPAERTLVRNEYLQVTGVRV